MNDDVSDDLEDALPPVVPEPEMVTAGELIEASRDRAALARRWDATVRAYGSHDAARAAEPKLYGLYYDFVLRPHRRRRRRQGQRRSFDQPHAYTKGAPECEATKRNR